MSLPSLGVYFLPASAHFLVLRLPSTNTALCLSAIVYPVDFFHYCSGPLSPYLSFLYLFPIFNHCLAWYLQNGYFWNSQFITYYILPFVAFFYPQSHWIISKDPSAEGFSSVPPVYLLHKLIFATAKCYF